MGDGILDATEGELSGPGDANHLRSALMVAGVAASTVAGALAASSLGLPAAVPTVAAGMILALAGRWMHLTHAAFAAVLAWCIVTGFAWNEHAELTFAKPDLLRLSIFGATALASTALGARRRASMQDLAAQPTTRPSNGPPSGANSVANTDC